MHGATLTAPLAGLRSPHPWGPRTWLDHAEAGKTLAQRHALPAGVRIPQHAELARLAGANAVPLRSARLSLHLVWRRSQQPGSPNNLPSDHSHSALPLPDHTPPHRASTSFPGQFPGKIWGALRKVHRQTPSLNCTARVGPDASKCVQHRCWATLSWSTYRRCTGSRSSGMWRPSSRAWCTCCPRKGHTRCPRSWCRRLSNAGLRKQTPEVSAGWGFFQDTGLTPCSPEFQG